MRYSKYFAFALVALLCGGSASAQVAPSHEPLVVLLSPSINQQDRADFMNQMEHFCMERLQPGDSVIVYDGTTLRTVASLQLNSQARMPRARMKTCVPFWNSLATFLKPADDSHAVQSPQFLNSMMQVFSGTRPRILIVGSPLYADPTEKKYDMTHGWLSDGYLNASPSESIFSIIGKSNLLTGSKIYYAYLTDNAFDAANDREIHKAKVLSFWGKYVEGLGGKLGALPNLKEAFALWADSSDVNTQHEPLNTNDKSMVINIPADQIVNTNKPSPPPPLPSDTLFNSGSAELKSEAASSLKETAANMNLNKAVRYRIDGYTDSHGSTGVNQKLSLKRADAVKSWLVNYGSVDASRLETAGHGKSNPKVPPGTSQEEAPNRRVEFVIIN
jgi:outer membrane protein OmpA-like peptidoglycan-associated protein